MLANHRFRGVAGHPTKTASVISNNANPEDGESHFLTFAIETHSSSSIESVLKFACLSLGRITLEHMLIMSYSITIAIDSSTSQDLCTTLYSGRLGHHKSATW